MRPDLPWNVAGIPSEAREAARAAARREGLSVGEWLTRRIVRSLAGETESIEPMRESYSPPPPYRAEPAPRPEPPPFRPESDDIFSRASRTDGETQDIYKRIETHLGGLGRRLEATERSTAENNRAMSKAATEINIAAREQAQAFDQLSAHVVGLSNRLERVEQAGSSDGMKDAVKTLHQGLSRLAEQIASTSKQAATQIETLAGSLEAVSARVADVRTNADGAARTMEQRMAMLDERVRVVERVAHSSADALDKALENMETRQQARTDETAEIHRRVGGVEHLNDALDRLTSRFASSEAQTATAIARMEDSVLRLESRGSDPAIDRRLNSIERTLGDIVARFENGSNTDESIRKLSQRLDDVENRRDEVVEQPRPVAAIPAEAAVYAAQPGFASQPAFPSNGGPEFDAPPFPEPTVAAAPAADPFANAFAPVFAPPPHAADTASVFGEFAPQATLATPPTFEPATFTPTTAPPPPVTNESFLAAARRSAQAAAAAVETEKTKGFAGFNWGPSAAAAPQAAAPSIVITADEAAPDTVKSNRSRYLLIGAGALILILAVTSIILSQNAGVTQAEQHNGIGALFSDTKKRAATTPAPTPKATAVPYTAADQIKPAPSAAADNDSFSAVPPKPKNATPDLSAPPAATRPTTAIDKLTMLANAGNAKAELLVGLKYIDGEGIPANDVEGAKWLQRAAAKNEPVASYRLGTLYERGKGVAADPAKATHWYQVAAQAGNRKAMHNLAVAFAQGSGTQKNFADAARWFSKAAALGLSDSQFNLAVLYERGLGVPQSLTDAYKWYAIAASQGDTESKARIDALTTQLSAEDRAAAQRSAEMFKPQALDRRANTAPDISDIAR